MDGRESIDIERRSLLANSDAGGGGGGSGGGGGGSAFVPLEDMPLIDHGENSSNNSKSYTTPPEPDPEGSGPTDGWPFCKICDRFKPLRYVLQHKDKRKKTRGEEKRRRKEEEKRRRGVEKERSRRERGEES